jgi:hypothetical protein
MKEKCSSVTLGLFNSGFLIFAFSNAILWLAVFSYARWA